MEKYVKPNNITIEIKVGSKFSAEFIEKNIILTEIYPYPWIDICFNAINIPFDPETIDIMICANVLHHIAKPIKFLLDLHSCLKAGGYVLINKTNPSFLF